MDRRVHAGLVCVQPGRYVPEGPVCALGAGMCPSCRGPGGQAMLNQRYVVDTLRTGVAATQSLSQNSHGLELSFGLELSLA